MELAKMIYFAMDEGAHGRECGRFEGTIHHKVHRQRFIFGMVRWLLIRAVIPQLESLTLIETDATLSELIIRHLHLQHQRLMLNIIKHSSHDQRSITAVTVKR